MKILVTGSRGFLGKQLVRAVRAHGNECIEATREADDSDQTAIQFNLADPVSKEMVTLLGSVETLVHLAWTSTPSISNQSPYRDAAINVAGTVRLFEAAANAGVRRIIFASSGGQVYGGAHNGLITETCATDPVSAYGIGKLACEKYLALFARNHGLHGISLRLANLYGAGQISKEGFGVIPTFVNAIRAGQLIKVYGHGKAVRDFVHVDDVVALLLSTLFHLGSGTYNIGSGVGTSIASLITTIEALGGISARCEHLPARLSDPHSVVLDTSQAVRELGFRPEISLETGISQVWNNQSSTSAQ
ncbi:MAG: NAD-dependent epimerase/dehydratase family protein [Nevskia sp.]